MGRARWVLTLLNGETVVQSVPFSWSLPEFDDVEITEDSQGAVWLSGENLIAIRVLLPKGEIMRYDLTPYQRKASKPQWNQVHLLDAAAGGQWLWSSNTFASSGGVDRPVRVEGEKLAPMGEIPALAGEVIKDIRVRDGGSLWFLTRKGLYDVSLEPLKATQVTNPASDVVLESIVPFGDRWIVITSGGASQSAIWELLPSGWGRHVVQANLHLMSRYRYSTPYYLNTNSGILVGTKAGWVWMPRGEGSARVIDGRDAWPLGRAGDMISLGGDRLFVQGSSADWPPGMEFHVRDFVGSEIGAPFFEWQPWQGWAVDSRERVFTLLDQSGQIAVLTDGQWSYFPLPKGFYEGHRYTVLADARDRAWVIQLDQKCMPVWILSPDLKDWEVLPGLDAALVKYGTDVANLRYSPELSVATGPRGQVAYLTKGRKLHYWNGSDWREWWVDDIIGSREGDRVQALFFSTEGDLCVNAVRSDTTRRLSNGADWSSEARRESADIELPADASESIPADFPDKGASRISAATDVGGRKWILADDQLFVSRDGRFSRLLRGESVRAFAASPLLREVRIDKAGNTWLRFGVDAAPSVVMIPKVSRVMPEAKVTVDDEGVARLECATDFFVEYRQEDGEWKPLKESKETINSFFEGDREIEVRFFSPELDAFGPQKISYRSGISWADRFRKSAEVFATGDDSAREAAIRLLKNKPAQALVILRERDARTETERWWIEAAIQECEREAGKPH